MQALVGGSKKVVEVSTRTCRSPTQGLMLMRLRQCSTTSSTWPHT